MTNAIRSELIGSLLGATEEQAVETFFAFMCDRGQSNYDESVTQIAHALQCAELADTGDCGDQIVTAALFHDIGHLLLDEHDSQSGFLHEDLNHEEAGAALLKDYFPEDVTEPIRLHVPAKRYLCTTDTSYYERLSAASKRSFQVQGGNLSADEQAQLESNPGLVVALRLRQFDDLGKQSGHNAPSIHTYTDSVKRCLRPDRP
ncbi:MAG: HD domain-containing protein [Planctomycetaceae bacterium]